MATASPPDLALRSSSIWSSAFSRPLHSSVAGTYLGHASITSAHLTSLPKDSTCIHWTIIAFNAQSSVTMSNFLKGCRKAPEVGLLGQRCQLGGAGTRRPRPWRIAVIAGHALLLRCKFFLGCRRADVRGS